MSTPRTELIKRNSPYKSLIGNLFHPGASFTSTTTRITNLSYPSYEKKKRKKEKKKKRKKKKKKFMQQEPNKPLICLGRLQKIPTEDVRLHGTSVQIIYRAYDM